jgi:hypothetical protein
MNSESKKSNKLTLSLHSKALSNKLFSSTIKAPTPLKPPNKTVEEAIANLQLYNQLTMPDTLKSSEKIKTKKNKTTDSLSKQKMILESYFTSNPKATSSRTVNENILASNPFKTNPKNTLTFHSIKATTRVEQEKKEQSQEDLIHTPTLKPKFELGKLSATSRTHLSHTLQSLKNAIYAVARHVSATSIDTLHDDYDSLKRNQELAYQLKTNETLNLALDTIYNNKKKAEAALTTLAKKAVEANGLNDENLNVIIYNSDTMSASQKKTVVLGNPISKADMNAFFDGANHVIYLNAAKMDGNKSQLISTLANELSHFVDANKGREFSQTRQDISTEYGYNALEQLEHYSGKESMPVKNVAKFKADIRLQDFGDANMNAADVVYVQPQIDFVGGAGDKENTDKYSEEIVKKMNDKGMNAHYIYTERSEGTPGKLGRALRSNLNLGEINAVHTIEDSYDRSDGQYTLVGYSMGSVDATYAAIRNARDGKVVDNLILIGSPIKENSHLMRNINKEDNIKNVIRYDIPDDPLAPTVDLSKAVKTKGEKHFFYTNNEDGQQDALVNDIYEKNIR